jgi:hypothetical protein
MANSNKPREPSDAIGGETDGTHKDGTHKDGTPKDGPAAESGPRSGRVQFDERGNAVWEWAIKTGKFGLEPTTERMHRLENPGLSLADDAPTPVDKVKPNPHGVVKGYNPYDSGKLAPGQTARKKTDLRKLSDWLKLKKQAAKNNPDEE